MNLFVTRDKGVIPFGQLPKWVTEQQSPTHYRCARILCENDPDISQLWKLEQIGITKEEFSPSKRETVSKVRSNIQKSKSRYILRLSLKSDAMPSTNYCTVRGQLNSPSQGTAHDEGFYDQDNGIIEDYVAKEFIEEIPNEPIEGHYLPHHPAYKKSATTPIRIVFNASSKPMRGKSLDNCLLTGPTLIAKLHDILLSFREGKYAVTADIFKAFHHVQVNERDRDYLKFLWMNPDQT